MAKAADFLNNIDQRSVEELFSEGELALTFTHIATLCLSGPANQRNMTNARKVYGLVSNRRFAYVLTARQRADLEYRLALLAMQLQEVGVKIPA